jgi:hypothetical protein
VLTQQELETPRSAADMLAWVDEAHARFNTRELKARAREGKHFANELIHEARPMALFAYRYYRASSQVTIAHVIGNLMPPGTPAKGVLEAARNFAREEFALKHRYALVLHTDEPHPHAHLVVKAMSEQGVRLNISPATLREWRHEFARHLRDQGIAANATGRAVRGETRTYKIDGIYRATRRGDSTYTRARTEAVAAELLKGKLRVEPGKATLIHTRKDVEREWFGVARILEREGHPELAARTVRFVQRMAPTRTEKEQIAAELERQRHTVSVREQSISR